MPAASPGGRSGIITTIWKRPPRRARFRQGAVALGAAGASAMGARRAGPRLGAEEARRLPARRHRAEDGLPVPADARRRRRADPDGRRRRNASTRSARSRRRSRSSTARKAASTTARSTTSPSASTTCGTGWKTCCSRDGDRHRHARCHIAVSLRGAKRRSNPRRAAEIASPPLAMTLGRRFDANNSAT